MVYWQLYGNLTGDVCLRDASFYQKSRIFYLLSRAHSIFINIISYVFVFYTLFFVIC